MATGRTTPNWLRAYLDGYDLSGDVRTIGPLDILYEDDTTAGLNWSVKGTLLGRCTASIGTLNAILNSATAGIHAVTAFQTPGARNVMLPIGIRAAPAAGDPVFAGVFEQISYGSEHGETLTGVTMKFGSMDVAAALNYDDLWGLMLHALGAETGANTGSGIDGLAASTAGGWMMYQVSAVQGTGTYEISIDDSTAAGSGFGALSGMTTGALAHTTVPCAGIIQIATNAAVKRYTRWQLALTGITSLTFALAFMRGR